MYTNRRYTGSVRDGTPRYGEGPVPTELYPAARVLDDLGHATDPDVPRILARYAALRAWLLGSGPAPTPESRHAASAALQHLGALAPDWPERPLLERLLGAPGRGHAPQLLDRAATTAEAAGHGHGARALREAAHRARWRATGYPPPSPS